MNYIIKTEGLMCGHCDATVETALLNVAGVTDADADHETQTVTVECSDDVTPEQLAEVEALVERGEKVHAGCDPSVDNMLKITGDGRKVALDPKLLYLEDDPDMEPLSGGKVDECVRNILDIRDRTEAERGAQLVFVDSSTPASGRWNLQDDVRRRLIEAGVPESEIACVTDAKGKSKQKEALYEKVRSGDIRILLGSTTTLGTGTNVQTRLAAIHDLDCPWRPSDLEQRLGRIVRQGNTFDRVHDFRYVSTGTFDSYLYSIVERKQRFISQVFTNKSPVRTMDDLDETVLSLAQMKQIAEGDPTVAERMDVENKIGQLKLMLASHLDGLADVQHKIETQYRPLVEALTAQRDMLADDEIPFAEADLVRQQTHVCQRVPFRRVIPACSGVICQERALFECHRNVREHHRRAAELIRMHPANTHPAAVDFVAHERPVAILHQERRASLQRDACLAV